MNTLQICPPHLSDVAILPWEIQKSHLSTLSFIYFKLFTFPQKKTNSNCCTADLAVYVMLFNASYYLHSPSTASGHATGEVRVLMWTCWGLQQRLIATLAEFQHSVMYYMTDQCRKRLEVCINAEGGHSEHLLWHCCLTSQLPHITTSSFQSHRRRPTAGFFRSYQRLKERNKPSVRWKSWHFQKGWASGLQFVFF